MKSKFELALQSASRNSMGEKQGVLSVNTSMETISSSQGKKLVARVMPQQQSIDQSNRVTVGSEEEPHHTHSDK